MATGSIDPSQSIDTLHFIASQSNPQLKRAEKATFKSLLKLGHNFSVKAFVANQLRHWHAWLRIKRAEMDLWLKGFERLSINLIAKHAGAHRQTVRACLSSRMSISDIKQALKHWSHMRVRAWSGKNFGVEQAKLDSNYLYCEPIGSTGQANKTSVVEFWEKSRPAAISERAARKVKDLALRASGLFRMSKLMTPQVGNLSTSNHDPPYD